MSRIFTSIRHRIVAVKEGQTPTQLMRFQGDEHKDKLPGIPFVLQHYIELVDWTGRIVRKGKRGSIDDSISPILERLGISEDVWLSIATEFEYRFKQWVGSEVAIQSAALRVGKSRSRSPPLIAA